MRTFARWALGAAMVFAGISHLFWARKEFRAQVPDWVVDATPLDEDAVVLASGAVEIREYTRSAADPAQADRPRAG